MEIQKVEAMKNPVKALGDKLRRAYDPVIDEPMSWRMIDALCRLDEAEQSDANAEPATGETTVPGADDVARHARRG